MSWVFRKRVIKLVKSEHVTSLLKTLQSPHFPEEAILPPHVAFRPSSI